MDDPVDLFGWVGGTVDGKYRVDGVVGGGGFGVVYRAHHLGFDQTVALKCLLLPKTLSGAERDRFRETFLSEGRLLHQLSRATAGIVQALDLGAAVSPNKHWTPYLVLEWLEGRPLDRDFAERRAQGPAGRSIGAAFELLTQPANALAVAHAQGVAHRDIKPANLFLTQIAGSEVVKVLDFGIAKVMAESESVTRAFEVTGASLQAFTARYGAPEQFSRRYGATGPWTDVFALALVFVEAVNGRHALEGTDAAQLFVSAADPERRPTLRTLGHASPDGVEEVLLRALAVDPRERYPHAEAFWSALEHAIEQAGLSAGHAAFAPSANLQTTVAPGQASAPEAVVNARTELSSSTHVKGNGAALSNSGSRRLRQILSGLGIGTLLLASVATLAIWREKPGAEESLEVEAQPSAAPAEPTRTLGTATPRSAARDQGASSAVIENPATPPRAALPFEGIPERDVEAGWVGQTSLGAFRILSREDAWGQDFANATRQCSDVGMALCSETQWVRACAKFPEIGKTPSWTLSTADQGVVVRGGDRCESRIIAAPDESPASRYGFCCDRSIAMTTKNLQKQFLAMTADRVLLLERAINQHNVQAVLDLCSPRVVIEGKARNPEELRSLFEADFRNEPDQIALHDSCEASVQAKKVTKRVGRRKKTVFETQTWTTHCRQTQLRSGEVTTHSIIYVFDASNKLREIQSVPAP